MKNSWLLLIIAVLLFSCSGETLPKPKPYLKLQYPVATYKKLETDCPYNFEISTLASVTYKNNCWLEVDYPPLKATIYITYRKVDNNLEEILREVDKLTYKHAIKADVIPDAKTFEYLDKKVFGKLNNVEGNVASNIQFSVTDSVKHVLSGSLYFYAKPNYDSIIPAVKYLEKDIMHLVETLEWK